MIGSLLYLTASKPYLCYSVGICARYKAYPKESHLISVKKIIKYVSGTMKFGLWYSHDSTTTLMGYYYADWAGNSNNRKVPRVGVFSWEQFYLMVYQKKKKLSIVEVEYIATRGSCWQLIWTKSMLQDYGVIKDVVASGMTLYRDNLNAINISKNPIHH